MPTALSFVHLSDIHFGQERGGKLITHTDVRDRLVEDIRSFFRSRTEHGGHGAAGILVSGDIAYGGKKPQYDEAGRFLDRVAAAAGCRPTDVRVAPGNHDIDLDEITHGVKTMLTTIRESGEEELDKHLVAPKDREQLYDRFGDYAVFAEGYGCNLDDYGGHAGVKDFELAPGRALRFVSWNSALLCCGKDLKGQLLLGAKQRTIPLEDGVESVVLCHHPLPWFADEVDARRFLKSRAMVLLVGHEHTPEIALEEVTPGKHFLTVAAGATCPPSGYDFTYNIIDFEFVAESNGMRVTVHPRVWVEASKAFNADFNRLGGRDSKACNLDCPQFRRASTITIAVPTTTPPPSSPDTTASVPGGASSGQAARHTSHEEEQFFNELRLKFFRILTRLQRLSILVELRALPEALDELPTMALERRALESLKRSGKLSELESAIDRGAAKTEGHSQK